MISRDTFLQIRHQFHNQGRGIRQIARKLGLDKKTITKWARQSEYSPGKPRHRLSILNSFKPTIFKLLHDGFSAKHIYKLLQCGGYGGGYTILRTFISREQIRVPVTPREFYAHRWMHRITPSSA